MWIKSHSSESFPIYSLLYMYVVTSTQQNPLYSELRTPNYEYSSHTPTDKFENQYKLSSEIGQSQLTCTGVRVHC